MLQRLDELKYQLPRSERRIAETILDNPEVVSYMRLNELAQAADVSIATVHRFCRSMGCDGFKELRQEIGRGMSAIAQQQATPSFTSNTSSHSLPYIVNEVNLSLSGLNTATNEVALAKAIKMLNSANRAIICSTDEDFHATSQEGASLLYKIGLPCEAKLSDQAISQCVPTLKKNDLAIFLITEQRNEPLRWLGSIKQLGSNSLVFNIGPMMTQHSADVSIALEGNTSDHTCQLLSQLGLIILFKYLSASVSPK